MKTFIKLCTLIVFVIQLHVYGQSSVVPNFGPLGSFIGWNVPTPFALDIMHQGNQPINFYTNAGGALLPPWLNQKMQINATANPLTDGFIGIGCAAPNGTTVFGPAFPAHRLDVDLGDININQNNNGYRIGGSGLSVSKYVLWHNGDPNNIFVGVGAGLSNPVVGSPANTFVGFNAGTINESRLSSKI